MDSIIIEDLISLSDKIKKITFSERKNKDFEYNKIAIRPFKAKEGIKWQLEQFKNTQVFHKNLSFEELTDWIKTTGEKQYRQALITSSGMDIHYTIFPDKTKRKASKNSIASALPVSHNREKTYLLKEGENIPALVDLGVFTKDFRIVKSKYDKYKQINRFIELIDDCYSKSGMTEITILDFGCGKSYLTFIIYYYFVYIKKIKATVIGFDLKKDVVENCNKIAIKYGYDNLKFHVNDVTTDKLYDGKIDMVITLHACDIATDYALLHAITHNVPRIFSVPCCQHEINNHIKPGGDFDIMLNHGLFKERFSALLTDSIRAEVLREAGYEVDVIEFVDFEHSPKNLMLRCTKKKLQNPDLNKISAICEKYSFKHTLVEELKKLQ